MRSPMALAAAAATTFAAAPLVALEAVPAGAQEPGLSVPGDGAAVLAERAGDAAHGRLVTRAERVATKLAAVRGHDLSSRYDDRLEDLGPRQLQRKHRRLRADLRDWRRDARRAARAQAGGGSVAVPAHLQAIAACESGGNPSAVGGGGAYRGKYQFDLGTWASVGGSGDPAAASEAEQDKRAAMLYAQRGAAPWPVCGS